MFVCECAFMHGCMYVGMYVFVGILFAPDTGLACICVGVCI
jgi:hypothetical protein